MHASDRMRLSIPPHEHDDSRMMGIAVLFVVGVLLLGALRIVVQSLSNSPPSTPAETRTERAGRLVLA